GAGSANTPGGGAPRYQPYNKGYVEPAGCAGQWDFKPNRSTRLFIEPIHKRRLADPAVVVRSCLSIREPWL
ncbi:MAG: hypothetical protein V3T84_13800, partial [Phycisphaerales bacterium]